MSEPTCAVCGLAIAWDPDEPTLQQPRWRHADLVAYYRAIAGSGVPNHRATPRNEEQP